MARSSNTTGTSSDKRKQSLYFPEAMLREIENEAARQDRSKSWIVQKAWMISRKEIAKFPSANDVPGMEDELEE
ncbi:MAG: TIGR04563 family protein [bacterium]